MQVSEVLRRSFPSGTMELDQTFVCECAALDRQPCCDRLAAP
jgi:hypothetical protein